MRDDALPIVVTVVVIVAIAVGVWLFRGVAFAPNVEARQAVALERIADALDRAFPIPAESQEPTPR